MHECPRCGYDCDCDMDDTYLPAPADCCHDCEDEIADLEDTGLEDLDPAIDLDEDNL